MPRKNLRKARRALAADHISRERLGREVQRRIEDLGLSRNEAGEVVNDAASQMSRLMKGHFDEFSADRLAGFLVSLGCDVDVIVTHRKRGRKRGKVRVIAKDGR